jgi:hypothetical protein
MLTLYLTIRILRLEVASACPHAIIRGVKNVVHLIEEIRSPASMVTKRQLGIFVITLSILGILGILAVDVFGAGQWSGLGPLQQGGIGLGAGGILVGTMLVRLGDRPA